MSSPGSTTILTMAPDGSDPQWLGQLGPVTPPVYSFAYPGGCDQMTAQLMRPPDWRIPAMDPGRIVQLYRGASKVWDGKMDEPQSSDQQGWTITAHGCGTFGTDFVAAWSSWTPGEVVSEGIARGLRWRLPAAGLSSTGMWLSQPQNPGSETITDALNAMTSLGGYGWAIDRRDLTASLMQLPVTADRFLIATQPVSRTITADVNAIYVRYCSADDGQGGQTYSFGWVTSAPGIAKHGRMEAFLDLGDAGVMTSGEAASAGQLILARYVRANWAGPFTVMQGQVLTVGGTPVDLGAEHAGHVYQLLLADSGYGGEVSQAAPITFIGGAHSYDDAAEVATITPFQSVADDIGSLMSALVSAVTPVSSTTTAST